jgi:hypothetical protein
MLRVASTLFSTSFCDTSGHTAVTLSSNGDTALIIVETLVCVVLLSGLIYCRHRHRMRTE